MINFHLRSSTILLFPQLKVVTLEQGLEACEFCASVFDAAPNWSVVLSSLDRNSNFPTVHFQCNTEGMFLQFFADENLAMNAKDGWFTLSNPSKRGAKNPIVPSELVDDHSSYFEALFADGVSVKKEYLCEKDAVIGVLSKMKSSEPSAWFAHGKWHNLGLI